MGRFDSLRADNPLGRVLAVYESNRTADAQMLESKLNEAALREISNLTKGLLFIKVISVVAPLMGLLGTVTGAISTFQVIEAYGSGSPVAMAEGIQQALIATVLGLIVAIPMVILHTLISRRSRAIMSILEKKSDALLAEHSA